MSRTRPAIISFDIDGTLVDFKAMLDAALQGVGQALADLGGGTALCAQDLQALRNQAAAEPAYAGAGLEALRRESFRRAAAGLGLAADAHAEDLWQVFLASRHPQRHLYPDVEPSLQALHAQGIRLAAASNGNTPLRESPLSAYFEAWFYAEEIGVAKPAPGFYQEAIRRLSAQPQDILHVGDSPAEDYWPALACGLRALLLHRGGGPGAADAAAVASLHELQDYLNAI